MRKSMICIGVTCGVLFFFQIPAVSAGNDATKKAELGLGDPGADTLSVFVSIVPQINFVERVGGARVTVDVLVLPGQNPHTYEPTPKQMMALAAARLYFRIGVPFENSLIPKIESSIRNLAIIDTRKNVPLRAMAGLGGEKVRRCEGVKGENADPHIWLAPPLIKIQARNIADGLIAADPVHEAEYRKNLAVFLDEIDAMDARITQTLAPCKGRSLYCFHPSYGYFADTYGLRQVPVEIEGKSPTPRQLRDLIEAAKADNAKVIFVQPQFDPKSAEQVARGIGGRVVPLDPLARDVLANLDVMAQAIREVCSP